MFTPFILFLGLTVATAVIAHWSDNLGKKLGKKRVSLFGLRPRTTATILTVASSWGIMLFTLAALLLTVAPLRNALFSYDRERAAADDDRKRFKREREAAKLNLQQTRIQRNLAQRDLGIANSSLETSRQAAKKAEEEGKKRAEAAQKRADAAKKRADDAEKGADDAQKRVESAQKRFEAAQKQFELAQKREAAAQRGEKSAQGETRNAKRETQTAQRETQKARQLRDEAAEDLEKSLATLEGAKEQLKATQNSLRATQSSLRATKKSLYAASKSAFAASKSAFAASKEAFEANKAAFEAKKTLRQTQQQIAVLEEDRRTLENVATVTLSNDAPIKIRQTFAERVIPANQTPAAIAVQLSQLLERGQKTFAKIEEDAPVFPPDAKIQLLPLPILDASGKPILDASGKPTFLEGERLLQSLARKIAEGGQTTSIRLVSFRNYLASEKLIEAVFEAVPIAPAFAEGEVLASTTIDGAQGDARIFRSLLDLIDLGRREAEKRGVNPPELFDVTNFYANDTNVRLFAALRFIASSQARLRVNLVADKALTTVEPLKVRFEIESGVPSAPSS